MVIWLSFEIRTNKPKFSDFSPVLLILGGEWILQPTSMDAVPMEVTLMKFLRFNSFKPIDILLNF